MKKKLLITYFLCVFSAVMSAQIKIGDNPQNIDAASVLELESTDRVLVITRVNTSQMNAIIPNQGAMVYNTDDQCIFYYDGTGWQNLCASQGLILTADPIINPYSTITITENGNQRNLEVSEIQGDVIADSSITGVDIQDDSISAADLQDNSVSDNEIDYTQVTLNDFTNDAGYLTSATIVSGDSGNDISNGTDGGAYFNAIAFEIAIQANADAIAADLDGDPANEIELPTGGNNGQVLSTDGAGLYSWVDNTGGGNPTDELNTTFEVNAGNLEITDAGGTLGIPLTSIDTDDQTAAEVTYDNTTSGLTATDTQAAIDEVAAAGGGNPTDELNTTFELNAGNLEITDAGGTLGIPLTSIDTDDQTAAEVTYDNTTSGLTATETQAAIDEIAAAGGGNPTDELNTTFELNAGNLEITDAGGTLGIPLTSIDTDDQTAAEVTYDNTTSGLTATETQAAIDEIVATSLAPHNGGLGAVYFADATGAPITNDDSFYWDETARAGTGALLVGIDANIPSTRAKVHIMEDLDTQLAYPLQLQNDSGLDTGGAGVGLLFSVEGLGSFGKGAIAYERMDSFGRGDFHILQENTASTNDPELINAVVTVKNNGNVGIGSTTPSSTLEIDGSFAAKIRTAVAGAVNDDDHTVVFTTSGNITLPAVATCTGRIYVLKNTSGVNSTIDNYLDANGNSANLLPPGVTWLQSDGINWHEIK